MRDCEPERVPHWTSERTRHQSELEQTSVRTHGIMHNLVTSTDGSEQRPQQLHGGLTREMGMMAGLSAWLGK